jgi:hypothetical protein
MRRLDCRNIVNFKPRVCCAVLLLACVEISLVVHGQTSSSPNGAWSGSIQCELDVQLPGFARQEVQAWTLTGEPPTRSGGTGVPSYPATWTYTGQGASRQMDGTRGSSAQWQINIVPGEAPFTINVREGVLVIRRASAQQKRYSGLTGQRQNMVNGVPQQPTPLGSSGLWEWALPVIEAAPGPSASGTLSVRAENVAEIQQPGPPPFATCKYQFSKTTAAPSNISQSCQGAIGQSFDGMKANLARDFDLLIQQTQDPARRAALNQQKQRLLSELEKLKLQNIGTGVQTCQGTPGTTVAQTGGAAAGTNPGLPGTASQPGAGQQGGAAQGAAGAGQQGGAAQGAAGAGQQGGAAQGAAGAGQQGGAAQGAAGAGQQGGAAQGGRTPPPQLVSVTPSSVEQGTAAVQVALKAQGTNWQMGTTTVDFGPGITVTGPFVTTPNDAYVLLAVASDAPAGPRPVSITANNQSISMPSAFTVNASSSSGQAPGSTSPINALGGGGPQTVYAGGNPTFTAVPTAQPPTQTAEVAPVQVTTTQAPAGTTTPAPSFGAPPNKAGFNKGGQQFTTASGTVPSQPTQQPPGSGKYLVTMTGLWCSSPTKDDPFGIDGQGDEIYAAAFVRRYDRGGSIQEYTSRQTMIYGDSNKAPDRIQAGTQTQLGGIRRYDSIPNNITADRRFDPQDRSSQFPYKLWGGTLTDSADVLLISPSIWESDNKTDYFLQWNQRQNSTINDIFLDTRVLDQINGKRFGAVTLGATGSVTGVAQQAGINAGIWAALGLIGLPPIPFFIGGGDRPVGLVENGPDQNALPNTAVVLTREIIETALSSPYNTLVPAAPGVNIQIAKPGIMIVPFVDISRNISGNVAPLEGDARAVYVMAIQVERCEGNLLQYCPD